MSEIFTLKHIHYRSCTNFEVLKIDSLNILFGSLQEDWAVIFFWRGDDLQKSTDNHNAEV